MKNKIEFVNATLFLKKMLLTAFLIFLFTATLAQAQEVNPDYETVHIGQVFGSNPILTGVNDLGYVTGYSLTNNVKPFRAFLWKENSAIEDLGHFDSRQDVNAWDINNKSEIVGKTRRSSDLRVVSYLWSEGYMSELHLSEISTDAISINENSVIADQQGIWSEGVLIGSLPQLQVTSNPIYPYEINDENVVVGRAFRSSTYQPVYWENNEIHLIGIGNNGQALDINNSKQIVGRLSPGVGFLWENGEITQTFPGTAVAVNNSGQVLIRLVDNTNTGAIWDPENGLQLLTDLIPQLPSTFIAEDLNENGDIIGGSSVTGYYLVKHLKDSNQTPIIEVGQNYLVDEGQTLEFNVVVTDSDGDQITTSVLNMPPDASFNPVTGEFVWTPTYENAGEYDIVFSAVEDTPEMLSASATVHVSVIDVNRPPLLDNVGNQTVNEGQILQFTVTAIDPDGDDVALSASNLPIGSTFDSNSGTFTWVTTYSDAGNYSDIEFTATDDGVPMELDVELITITIGNVNRAPILSNPGPQTVIETENISFTIFATDPDGGTITLSASNTPAGASFNSATGEFSWTPTLSQEGVYTVTFVATDDGEPVESGFIDVVITVGDNPTPTEQTQDLIEDIVNFDFPTNIENSYLANLQKVEQFILDGKVNPALNQLSALINKLDQDYQQGLLSTSQYNTLLSATTKLIADLTAS